MSLFSLQFSSSSDILAYLMRIPPYFLPECLHAENTQVCTPALSLHYLIIRKWECGNVLSLS